MGSDVTIHQLGSILARIVPVAANTPTLVNDEFTSEPAITLATHA